MAENPAFDTKPYRGIWVDVDGPDNVDVHLPKDCNLRIQELTSNMVYWDCNEGTVIMALIKKEKENK